MAVGNKLAQAVRAAAALGFLTLTRRDSLSVHTFPTGRAPRSPRFVGRSAVGPFFRHLEGLFAEGHSDLVGPVMDLLGRPGPRGHTIVFSDLLADDWEKAIARLPSRGDDLTVVHVLAPEDIVSDALGELDLVDIETGHRVPISVSTSVSAAHDQRVAAWMTAVSARCRHVGAAYVELRTDHDLRTELRRAWRNSGVLR